MYNLEETYLFEDIDSVQLVCIQAHGEFVHDTLWRSVKDYL